MTISKTTTGDTVTLTFSLKELNDLYAANGRLRTDVSTRWAGAGNVETLRKATVKKTLTPDQKKGIALEYGIRCALSVATEASEKKKTKKSA